MISTRCAIFGLFLLINQVICETNGTPQNGLILASPKVTNFGEFGAIEKCPTNEVVTAFQVKVEPKRPSRFDNTALNAIRFFCGNPNEKVPLESAVYITSTEGRFGSYQKIQNCSTYAIGFQLKSQKYQGTWHDDVGAVNLKLICAGGSEIEGYDEEGDYYPDASYTDPQFCMDGLGICAIQTQVEGYQVIRDDTSLNNLRVICCKLPEESSPTTPEHIEESTEGTTNMTTEENLPDTDDLVTNSTQEPMTSTMLPEIVTTEESTPEQSTQELVTEAATHESVTNEASPEASSQEATTPEVVPEEATQEATTPEVVPEEATQEATTPEVVPEEATQEATTPEVVPEEVTQEAATPEVVPEETTQEATTSELVPEEAITPEEATQEATSPEVVTEEANKEATTPDVVPQEATTPEETTHQIVTEVLPQEITSEVPFPQEETEEEGTSEVTNENGVTSRIF